MDKDTLEKAARAALEADGWAKWDRNYAEPTSFGMGHDAAYAIVRAIAPIIAAAERRGCAKIANKRSKQWEDETAFTDLEDFPKRERGREARIIATAILARTDDE